MGTIIYTALAVAGLLTLAPVTQGTYREARAWWAKRTSYVGQHAFVPPARVWHGSDTNGCRWSVRYREDRGFTLYQGRRRRCDAGGTVTMNTLTARYGITWDR